MNKRRKKMLLRYSSYIAVLGITSFSLAVYIYNELVDEKKYEDLRNDYANEEESEIEIIDFNDMISESVKYTEEAMSDIESTLEEELEEESTEEMSFAMELPRVSDELLLSGYEFKDINFAELQERNADVDAWITIDNTKIDYPVMYAPEKETDFYLHHDIDGNYSKAGSLYVYSDCASLNNPEEELNGVTFIYGHHMRGDKMFAQVFDYYRQTFYDEHPFGIIYTPDGYAFKAEFFAGIIVPGSQREGIYASYFTDDEMFNDFVENLVEQSTFTSDVEPVFGDKIIALQTCEYTRGSDSRYILYGILKKQYTDELQIGENEQNISRLTR